MNNIKSYKDFIFEMKSAKDIVRDLARHLAFDKDIIEYLNTSRAKRKIGWREMLDSKLHGKNKDYINYLTKNMIADYNPQITGYIQIEKDDGDFDVEQEAEKKEFDDMSTKEQIKDLDYRMSGVENVLGIDPKDKDSLERVEKALDDAGYEKPEPEEETKEEEDKVEEYKEEDDKEEEE